MIKRFFLVILLVLILVPLYADYYEHHIYGQIRTSVVFEVNIMEEVLPFDLNSALVQYNDTPSVATGLRLGSYRLISNNDNLKMVVSHTPLHLQDNTGTENNEINYRLYLMTGIGSPGFVSTTGSAVEIVGSDVSTEGMVSLVDKYMYITLDEGSAENTANKVSAIEAGTYESTITFELWVR